jgi:hypothetical protein
VSLVFVGVTNFVADSTHKVIKSSAIHRIRDLTLVQEKGLPRCLKETAGRTMAKQQGCHLAQKYSLQVGKLRRRLLQQSHRTVDHVHHPVVFLQSKRIAGSESLRGPRQCIHLIDLQTICCIFYFPWNLYLNSYRSHLNHPHDLVFALKYLWISGQIVSQHRKAFHLDWRLLNETQFISVFFACFSDPASCTSASSRIIWSDVISVCLALQASTVGDWPCGIEP